MGRHARIMFLRADAASTSYLRHLNPGGLARFRFSHISARNHPAVGSRPRIYSLHNSPAVPTHIVPGDGFSLFSDLDPRLTMSSEEETRRC
ncbi:unnamed protein product [Cuscuta campestris]|uniref:Uncharacterized protein n=1 Tax=Cuscuta campestris TaxID=132261 RepID=A0A484KX03_9ASTE|nr:unnamed protein product [Cuscuta campestris]